MSLEYILTFLGKFFLYMYMGKTNNNNNADIVLHNNRHRYFLLYTTTVYTK